LRLAPAPAPVRPRDRPVRRVVPPRAARAVGGGAQLVVAPG